MFWDPEAILLVTVWLSWVRKDHIANASDEVLQLLSHTRGGCGWGWDWCCSAFSNLVFSFSSNSNVLCFESLNWTQLVVSTVQTLKVMVGFRLRPEYWKRVLLSSPTLVTAVLLVTARWAPRRWVVLCETGLGCVWEEEDSVSRNSGEPEDLLCLASSLPTEIEDRDQRSHC